MTANEYGVSFQDDENILKLIMVTLFNPVNVLIITELYALNC